MEIARFERFVTNVAAQLPNSSWRIQERTTIAVLCEELLSGGTAVVVLTSVSHKDCPMLRLT